MAARVPRYIPSPDWTISPDTSGVELGRFIKNRDNPRSFVSSHPVLPVENVQTHQQRPWKAILDDTRSNEVSLWAKCFQIVGLGGDLSMSRLKSACQVHSFEIMETRSFEPSQAYIERAITAQAVMPYIECSTFRKPIYMIAGLMIARGATVTSGSDSTTTLHADIGADTTPVGVPLALGTDLTTERRAHTSVSFSTSNDYIFAYRLMRVRKKADRPVQAEDYNRGAAFGLSDHSVDDEDDEEIKAFAQLFDFDFDQDDMGIPENTQSIDSWRDTYQSGRSQFDS